MTRSPDILFIAEYMKNVLYFATVRQGKVLKDSTEAHYFTIDDQLVYENYYSDFGPLNLGCVYKYCTILDEKLKQYLKKQIVIVHYTSIDPKKKANAAFLLGCYGVIYLSLPAKDAIKPLQVHGQTYRPFQDATQGDSPYTISLMDCLQAIAKARTLGFFNFQDFNYDEYERLGKIQGGDLNWIVPGKFLAFIGPVDYSVNLYHPPEMYVDYFMDNDVQIVIRLNKRLYDSSVFSNVGIVHYDLFFPDGSCPPRHILMKFLQISEKSDGAIAVHCKAGLGRTGSLIGCYLIKHYRMTAREAIGWMRICRPGSVIGQQQGWLEHLEAWLIKQGNFYRKSLYRDIDRLPKHQYGVYSVAEKTQKQKPVTFNKSPSPPPPVQRQTRSDIAPVRPNASRTRDGSLLKDKSDPDDEIFLTSCDLTLKPKVPMIQMKGCVLKTTPIEDEIDGIPNDRRLSLWRVLFCCEPCAEVLKDCFWPLAVRCANAMPQLCYENKCCTFINMSKQGIEMQIIEVHDKYRTPKSPTKKEQFEWYVTTSPVNTYINKTQESRETSSTVSRRSGAGEPRIPRSPVRGRSARLQEQRTSNNSRLESSPKNLSSCYRIPTFLTTQGPVIKTVTDAKQFLMRSSMENKEYNKRLNSTITVTPQYSSRITNFLNERSTPENTSHFTPSYFSTVSKANTPHQQRRRLGRSPSPPPSKLVIEQTRATNTPVNPTTDKFLAKDSKTNLRAALSRLKVTNPRNGSIGAASLGARREAPSPRRAPSVRSDERPLATQGDKLNSIKFQRRFRDSLQDDKVTTLYHDKTCLMSTTSRDKSSVKSGQTKSSGSGTKSTRLNPDLSPSQESPPRNFFRAHRPSSPKGGRTMQPSFY